MDIQSSGDMDRPYGHMAITSGRFAKYDILNERYARRWGGRVVIYGRPCKTIHVDACNQYAARLRLAVRKTRGYHLDIAGAKLIPRTAECSKELMMLQLIAGQVDKVISILKTLEGEPPCLLPHYAIAAKQRDVRLCDALDTLAELERKAEGMAIRHHEQFLVEPYHDEESVCNCRQCEPTLEILQDLWESAEVAYDDAMSRERALYERVFSELRRGATA